MVLPHIDTGKSSPQEIKSRCLSTLVLLFAASLAPKL
jgi:hypothetical protein